MALRYKADIRTVLWILFAAMNAVAIWMFPTSRWYLTPVACYFALSIGIIAHNHNHLPTFYGRWRNDWLNHAATIFYGFAAFNWIPTHNLNHHKETNGPNDDTRTWRFTNRHNALVAFTYPAVSVAGQIPAINAFVRDAKARKPRLYRQIMIQLIICWGLPAVLTLIDWRATVCCIWIPRVASIYLITYFNYGQHVHCDPYSEWNHSRCFTGKVLNFFLFNNGFHTVHHRKPGAHWSTLPALHEEIAHHIDPRLVQRSLFVWMFRSYVLGLFNDRFATHQVGRAPFDPPAHMVTTEAAEQEPHLVAS